MYISPVGNCSYTIPHRHTGGWSGLTTGQLDMWKDGMAKPWRHAPCHVHFNPGAHFQSAFGSLTVSVRRDHVSTAHEATTKDSPQEQIIAEYPMQIDTLHSNSSRVHKANTTNSKQRAQGSTCSINFQEVQGDQRPYFLQRKGAQHN